MSTNVIPDREDSWILKPRRILSTSQLATLNRKNDRSGYIQLCGHLAISIVSGVLWGYYMTRNPFIALPALIIYGFSFASMFAPMHECGHRTAFANPRVNDAAAWFAGLLSFYNATFYRYYHKWHHRYTQIPGKDPELEDIKPSNWKEYILEISGFYWWTGKLKGHFRIATGNLEGCPYIPETARDEVIRSVRLQLLVYSIALLLGREYFLLYWLLPLAVGQPILRAILLSEHTGCTHDDNPLSNTRTTLTLAPIRFLMWNMPYHAEHHLYPSIPFHTLAEAHEILKNHFTSVDAGYIQVNRSIVRTFSGS